MFRFLRPPSLALFLLCSSSAWSGALPSRVLDAVPLNLLDTAALERVRNALPERGPRDPVRLAMTVPMSLGLAQGSWSQQGDIAMWRARVQSTGATLLVAGFDRVNLPARAELRWSSLDGEVVQGPYTAADVNDAGELWTALIPGDEALLELRVPTAQREAVALHLDRLGHGVHALDRSGVSAKSGSCNIDVVCSQGNNWRDQIRSVVHVQIPVRGGLFSGDSITLCSGQLVNNTTQNGDPLLLTATHCGITAANASSVMVYYNFQTSSCGGTPNGSFTQTQRAQSRLFSHVRSDHTLLRLNGAPNPSFNAYLTGFNATAQLPQNGVAIHHPSGDEKRISVYSSGSAYQQVVLSPGTATVDAYRVRWAEGTTEGGSSGGGLWNQDRALVGVLSAGNASCGNINGDDFFGRLDLAWNAGLDDFLDPSGSGVLSVPGRNASGGGGGGGSVPIPPSAPGSPNSTVSGSGGGGAFGYAGLLMLFVAGGTRRRSIPKRYLARATNGKFPGFSMDSTARSISRPGQ